MKYISRHSVKPLLKSLNKVLIGFQKASQNDNYVYVWLLYDLSEGISLNFIENAKVFPRNSYTRVYTTKENAWDLFHHYLEELKYTKESFDEFDTDTYWVDTEGKFKEFIKIMQINPTLSTGEELFIKITNTTNLPKFLKDKIKNNEFSTEEDKRKYIEKQIKSHLVSLVNSEEEELDLLLMSMSDSENNLMFDEFEICKKETKHTLIEAVPISYDILLEQLNKY